MSFCFFPCCHKKQQPFYAQYRVQENPSSNPYLSFSPVFQEGDGIVQTSPTEILLSAGYLYLIDFLFLATPKVNGFFQVTPRINDTLQLLYSAFAPANATEQNATASGSFTTNLAASEDATLSFRLSYGTTVQNIDISGAVSITPLIRL